MSQLVPHLLVRTESPKSDLAIALREAGYIVSRVVDDKESVLAAAFEHIDGVIVELPAVLAISFVRKMRAHASSANALILVATASPDTLRWACPGTDVLDIGHPHFDIVSTMDLLLARRRRATRSHAS